MPPAIPVLRRLRRYCQANPVDALVSVAGIIGVCTLFAMAFKWAVLDSVWLAQSMQECREMADGACWAVLRERGRIVIFGLYPFEEQWRVIVACTILLITAVCSCLSVCQRFFVISVLWMLSLLTFTVLMNGGVLGLEPVSNAEWGGLALTFYLFAFCVIVGMPIAMGLAITRHMGPTWARVIVGSIVDLVRSIPLTAILLAMALVVPLFVPGWLAADKLWRVAFGFTIFFACYQSEIFRGAFQSVDRGQWEGAKSLGLKPWQVQRTVILPQVFRASLPQTVNQVVAAFKDTSYIAIVGFFDMTASASSALGTGAWASAFVEVYTFVAFIYLIFGYSLSRYGAYLENKTDLAFQR